jgi:hypothetical protein
MSRPVHNRAVLELAALVKRTPKNNNPWTPANKRRPNCASILVILAPTNKRRLANAGGTESRFRWC